MKKNNSDIDNDKNNIDDNVENIIKKVENIQNDRVLKLLNSNTEDPYIIWDNSTRNELLEFVEKHRNSAQNTVFL